MLGNPLGEGLPWPNCSGKISIEMGTTTLQNSPYLCVFKYARAVKQKPGARLKRRKGWGEMKLVRFARARLRATLNRF